MDAPACTSTALHMALHVDRSVGAARNGPTGSERLTHPPACKPRRLTDHGVQLTLAPPRCPCAGMRSIVQELMWRCPGHELLQSAASTMWKLLDKLGVCFFCWFCVALALGISGTDAQLLPAVLTLPRRFPAH